MEEKDKHPRYVVGYYGSFKELAQAIGNMSYDQIATFIGELVSDLEAQADADLTVRGRKKLSKELYEAAECLKKAQIKINSAWNICKPYMT